MIEMPKVSRIAKYCSLIELLLYRYLILNLFVMPKVREEGRAGEISGVTESLWLFDEVTY